MLLSLHATSQEAHTVTVLHIGDKPTSPPMLRKFPLGTHSTCDTPDTAQRVHAHRDYSEHTP